MKSLLVKGNLLRMAGFPFALGLIGVFVSGTLNRVMIVELGIPATLVGLFLAVPLLLSPLRMWLGYRSDVAPLGGLRREPYIILGALFSALGVAAATLLAVNASTLPIFVVLGLLVAFMAYGIGKHLSSNTFEALIADKFEGTARSRAVTLFKVPMFVGIIGGAIGLGRLLDPFSIERLVGVVFGVAGIAFVFGGLAVIHQEPRTTLITAASQQARRTPFFQVVRKLIWEDRQARLFFIFVMLAIIGTQTQEILLEPFGALVLDMSVAETTRLTSYWGTGAILSMLIAGGWLIKRVGYRPVLRGGLLSNVAVFAGIIVAGQMGSVGMFRGLVFVLGFGTGFAAAGALSAVVDFTTSVRAGFLMGVWGAASELGEATGNLFGGAIVDVLRAATGSPQIAYSAVFAVEGILLIGALLLLRRINIQASVALNEASHEGDALEDIPTSAVPRPATGR